MEIYRCIYTDPLTALSALNAREQSQVFGDVHLYFQFVSYSESFTEININLAKKTREQLHKCTRLHRHTTIKTRTHSVKDIYKVKKY